MKKQSARIAGGLLATLLLLHPAAASGQDAMPAEPPSLEQVEKQSEAIRNDASLEETLRQAIVQNLQQATDSLKRATAFADSTAEFERQIQQAPSSLAAIKQELETPAAPVELAPGSAKPLTAWEQELQQATADLATVRQQFAELDAENNKRTVRRSELPGLLAAASALRKELLIPNKQFVTGELVNWTLTNSVLRIVVPFGIAYGSDTKKAQRILLEIAKNYRMAVDDAFRKAGIEIAFPQRDLHIRSSCFPFAPEDIATPGTPE
ncbi:Mechanosensitive channel MscK [Pontiella desulfatans]|uniref:Mechanosensitive channel MscK n=1 Tax=Pontiella desulfatans TaxID=2750659 RepID=A0A6C2UB75_PONDE|nr:mechanosensitive ion channel domain-containing protein [Pontiella desulfatans]VGO17113.1 Mechanosensitive channel MscK [Pontiella desulfatans]